MSILLALAAAAALIPPDEAAFHNALAAAHAELLKKTDRFAAPPGDGLEGAPFSITEPMPDELGQRPPGRGIGRWEYADGQLTLRIPTSVGNGLSGRDLVSTISVFDGKDGGGHYRGKNAYGAAATVSYGHYRGDAIAMVDGPFATPPEGALGRAMGFVGQDYHLKLQLLGPAAKELTPHIKVRISGQLAKLKSGRVTDCEVTYSGATVASPYASGGETCWAGAIVDTIVIFDDRSPSQPLRTWTRTGAP